MGAQCTGCQPAQYSGCKPDGCFGNGRQVGIDQIKCDFQIEAGILLVKGRHSLDLHNFYKFVAVTYAIETQSVTLKWRRADRQEIPKDIPSALSIEFNEVSVFEFLLRDGDQPFSEDDCLATFGNWHHDGAVIIYDDGISNQEEPIAISFMSGATIVIAAMCASATISFARE